MKRLVIIMFGLMAACSVHAKDSCEPAVDAADSMNVNQQDCDYSDKGLNGFLQKAFKKAEEGAVLETGTAGKVSAVSATADVNTAALAKAQKSPSQSFTLSIEVDQWANVPVARTQLLPKALTKCERGFAITGESYRSLAMGKIELRLEFECEN